MAKSGRIRTESMIDRLGKKPMSEGFDLWDKDYMLGALRLFQCKLEVSPPFEIAACVDAVGDILTAIEEPDEARDHFVLAVDKYSMINKKVLSELMKLKAAELEEGHTIEETLEAVDKYLSVFEARRAEGKTGKELLGDEAKNQGTALGRMYLYKAELLKEVERYDDALAVVDIAIDLKCDRVHLAHGVRGDILMSLDKSDEAIGAYQDAIGARECFLPAHESLIRAYRASERDPDAVDVIDAALKLHPKAVLLRDKAFIISGMGDDDAALKVLDEAIKEPPCEETESSIGTDSHSVCTLRKAKVAILADLGRFEDANAELSHILSAEPDDEEATMMRKDIYLALARDYLQSHDIPMYLDSLVAKVLDEKPDTPVSFMIECIEKELEANKS